MGAVVCAGFPMASTSFGRFMVFYCVDPKQCGVFLNYAALNLGVFTSLQSWAGWSLFGIEGRVWASGMVAGLARAIVEPSLQ